MTFTHMCFIYYHGGINGEKRDKLYGQSTCAGRNELQANTIHS
jgi:hypothetical protein